jgi:SAM-dependent methyltransferase
MEENKDAATGAMHWDRQFAAGEWAYLHGLDELAHHSVIAGYVAYFGRPASVLDVACGEGRLRRLLPREVDYLGVDWSAVAVENARRQADGNARFAVADVGAYVPDREFDFIVFNECLYYFQPAEAALRRYAAHLAHGGRLIVSMYDTEAHGRIWRTLEAGFETLDRVQVVNAGGTAWNIAMLAPGSGL